MSAPKPPHVTSNPASGAPKPVQCTSVPDTPVNATTPATGSPAPELKIEQEPVGQGLAPQVDDDAILGPQDPSNPKRQAPEPEVDIAGPDSASVPQEQDSNDHPPASESEPGASDAPPGKKAKLTEKAANLVDNVKAKVGGKIDSSNSGSNNKDKVRPVAGKTERKTRSQGPVDAAGGDGSLA